MSEIRTDQKQGSSCQTSNGNLGTDKEIRKPQKKHSEKYFTPEHIVAWAEHKAGIRPKETQEHLDLSKTTYYRYIEAVDEVLEQSIDIERARKVTFLMFPLVVKSIQNLLKDCHPGMTIAFLNGYGIFKKHLHGEGMGDQHFIQIINNIPEGVLSDTEPEDEPGRLTNI